MNPTSLKQSLKQASECAEKLKVLSDPTRMKVIEALRSGPRHVGALVKALKIEQSLLSHHLQSLRAAGLVECDRDGKAVLYRLASSAALAEQGGKIDLGCCQLSFD
jgi:DNA-binding transcriptional ArsR family regulator